MSSVHQLKVTSAVVLFFLTLVSGVTPIFFKKFKSSWTLNPVYVSIGNCITAGVFLTMGLTHILFEAAEDEIKFGERWGLHGNLHVHLFMMSFIVILGFECLLGEETINHQATQGKQKYDNLDVTPEKKKPLMIELDRVDSKKGDNLVSRADESPNQEQSTQSHDDWQRRSWSKFILILSALSIHSLSTAMAMGVLSEYNSVLTILLGTIDSSAILAHKVIETMTLSFNLLLNVDSTLKQIFWITIYSLLSPLGIFLGILVSNRQPILQMASKSISAGTLFYVAAVEIVCEEFIKSKPSLNKFVSISLGSILIVCTTLIFDEEEE